MFSWISRHASSSCVHRPVLGELLVFSGVVLMVGWLVVVEVLGWVLGVGRVGDAALGIRKCLLWGTRQLAG